jgi:ABC-type multidrug transport system ATPase subunit
VSVAESGYSIEMESAVGRYGARDVVGPVTARLEGPGLYWIVGPNGSGKSTLLRLLAGLKRAGAGRVRWTRDGAELASSALRFHSGISAPEIQLYRDLSVRENLEFLARLRGRGDARHTLARCGLEALAGERPMSLSSGQRLRARLGAAWLGDPEIVLLDEPSTNLDDEARSWLWREVRERASRSLCVATTNQREELLPGEPRIDLGARMVA